MLKKDLPLWIVFLGVAGGAFLTAGEFPHVVTTGRDGVWVFSTDEGRVEENGDFYLIAPECEPWHLRKADLNGDGMADIVSSNRYGPSIAVFINDGEGFEDPVTYEAGPKPYATAAGDFDSDGDNDLAVVNPVAGGTLVLLENQSDGTFERYDELFLGDKTYGIESGDLDKNGTPDLVVVNRGTGNIVILLGEGDGTFTQSDTLFAEKSPKSPCVGDFNNDKLPDFAVVNYDSSSVSVFLNQGAGSFTSAGAHAAGSMPRYVVAGDLDSDGNGDLVVSGGRGSEEIFVLYGDGEGGFTKADSYHTGPRPNSVAVADMNSDGMEDILAANWSLGNEELACVSVLEGVGKRRFEKRRDFAPPGGFAKLTFVLTVKLGKETVSFIRGDVNGDGKINISDPVRILYFLFGFSTISCLDAADVNDNGSVNMADPVMLLQWLFGDGPPPEPPYLEPGADSTPDELWCKQ